MSGTAGVFTALALSACVATGAAYVAVDYLLSPFEDAAIAALPPIAQPQIDAPQAPVLAAAPQVGSFGDPRPVWAETATLSGAPAYVPAPAVRRIAGRPAVVPPLRPGSGRAMVQLARLLSMAEARALPGPAPRPGGFADPAQPALVEVSLQPSETQIAVLNPEDGGLTISLRPAGRPAGLAAVVASARRPQAEEAASGVDVARAAAPEVELVPAALSDTRGGLFTPGRVANPCGNRLTRAIPSRPRSAPGGSQLVAALEGTGGADRDSRLLQAAYSGNVPNFLRDLRPVSFTGQDVGGRDVVVTICVTPDYLAVGSDRDFIRVPLGLPAALQLAERFNMTLPTTRMVDAIYAQADLRLAPQPMSPGPQMSSTGYFMRHDAMVDDQHARTGTGIGVLVAGHKKDVVLANRLSSNPGRVAIYGWHRQSGDPIQPLSTVHGAQYADYSHGVRLVSRTAYVNGQPVDIGSLLTDSRYAAILNSDGPITGRAGQMAALR